MAFDLYSVSFEVIQYLYVTNRPKYKFSSCEVVKFKGTVHPTDVVPNLYFFCGILGKCLSGFGNTVEVNRVT